MASAEESQAFTVLGDNLYDDPSQLSQALRQRAGIYHPLHFTTSTESHPPTNQALAHPAEWLSYSADAPPQQGPIEANPTHPPHATSRRVPTTRHGKPRLPKTFSAPTSTGFIMEKEGVERMVQSFGGMDAPGDTQPDSQMNIYTSGALLVSTVSTRKLSPRSLFDQIEEQDGDSPTDGVEGVESSQYQHSPTITSPTVIQEDFPETLPQIDQALTSPLKFETPALTGKKRDSYGQLLSSAVRTNTTTPGTILSASAFFGAGFGNGGVGQPMSLTQAFNATQAGTSPLVGQPREDPVFQRPSPNFAYARPSSPLPAISSPIKAVGSEMGRTDPILRSSSEPRAEYVTMKQSQERRKRETEDEDAAADAHDSWDEPSAAQKRIMQRKAREQFERQTAMSLSNISAPTPSTSRSVKKRGLLSTSSKYSSPVKSRVSARPAPFDGPFDDSLPPISVNVDDDDSPDELSQGISSSPHLTRTPAPKATRNKVEVPQTSSHPRRTLSGRLALNSSQLQNKPQRRQKDSQVGMFHREGSKDSVAIMDSQPDAIAESDSIPRSKSLRFPSSPSTNQYSIHLTTLPTKTGYTSQRLSSSVPLPPDLTQSEIDGPAEEKLMHESEERVPSSPPVVDNEDDIVYDEHAYEEHSEDEVDENGELQLPSQAANMYEEEELPVPNQGVSDEEQQHSPKQPASEGKGEEEMETEMEQPVKVEGGSDYEVPETLEHGDSEDHVYRIIPRARRQNTVPESDMLDNTQPSGFPDRQLAAHNSSSTKSTTNHTSVSSPTNNTEVFHTANEDQQASGSNLNSNEVLSHNTNDKSVVEPSRVRSLNDLADVPDTQHSSWGSIEMPQLSGVEPGEMDAMMALPSPVGPPAKKRKVTYTNKMRGRRGSLHGTNETDKQTENPQSSPLKQVQQAHDNSPPPVSTQEREEQGASAATTARQGAETLFTRSATLKSKGLPKTTRSRALRKGALKPVKKTVVNSSPLQSPDTEANPSATTIAAATTLGTDGEVETADSKAEPLSTSPVSQADIDMADDSDGSENLAAPAPGFPEKDQKLDAEPRQEKESAGQRLVPNRIFAYWPGRHFYPATCIGVSSSTTLRVRYDEGTINTLETHLVRALELRPGDHVKVDEPGMKKSTFIVTGFKDKIDDPNGEDFPITDQLGYSTAILEEKQRESLPSAKARNSKEQVSVPVASIYITNQLWPKLRDRLFRFSQVASPDGPNTAVGSPTTAEGGNALSFSRRAMTGSSLLKEATARAGSVASSARASATLFSNMVFAITSTGSSYSEDARGALKRIITSNGGQVLEDGFHELFDYESSDIPSSQPGRKKSIPSDEGLVLKAEYKNLGFVALISDAYVRSPKYIQALALNVPCLHLRWIHDSLAASRPLSFAKYLLPAGLSTFLDPEGVVRSRMMSLYDPGNSDVTFTETVDERDLLLHGQSILFVTGVSKKDIEKKQPYIFLTHAMGPAKIGRCTDIPAAKRMLEDGSWDWVYVDGGPQGVADSASSLFGAKKRVVKVKSKSKGRRRKRDGSEESEASVTQLIQKGEINGRTIKITCDEFVIQSLILGALVEE